MRTKISWILLLLSILLLTETKAQIIREKQRDIFGSPAKACGLSIDSRKSKQEEFSVYDASELRSKLFDFCIEGFRRSIGRTVDEIV